jgi:hypothetical protein
MPVITELEREGRVVEINAAQTPEQVWAYRRARSCHALECG